MNKSGYPAARLLPPVPIPLAPDLWPLTPGQLDGRIACRLDLPATLPESDLAAIVKYNLLNVVKKDIEGVCEYALTLWT